MNTTHQQRRANTAHISNTILARTLDRKPKGFTNVGGYSCYRLAMLQALLHAPRLVNWARQEAATNAHTDPNHRAFAMCWLCTFAELANTVWILDADRRTGPRTRGQLLLPPPGATPDNARAALDAELLNMHGALGTLPALQNVLTSTHHEDAADYLRLFYGAAFDFLNNFNQYVLPRE